jgi:hypothetical protein
MKTKCVIISNLFVFVILVIASYGGSFNPMQPNIQNGGRAVSVARHPSNNTSFIVASETGGLFRSTNTGVTWNQVSGSSTFWFNDARYCEANPAIIIAVASCDMKVSNGGGVWRSINGGTSWKHIALSTPDPACATSLSAYCVANEPGANKMWIGTSCGLAYSTNNGASWTFIASSSNYHNDVVYAVLTPQANQIKILTDDGVKVSTNEGTSWSFSTTGLPYISKGVHSQVACSPLNHRHIFWACNFIPSDDKWHNGLYASYDNGNTWINLIDNHGINRPPFCNAALALDGNANHINVYYSDGGCTLQRGTFINGTTPTLSGSWVGLNTPHCDYSDISFNMDGKTPALLTGDGGIMSTADNGANWTMTGGGVNGYNALQITEVTGQLHSSGNNSDLYFGTQDNNICSSPDGGVTWPTANSICCEGFFINVNRSYLPASSTKVTGVDCGPCGNFMTGPLLTSYEGFPNVPNSTGNPCLIRPGTYIENDTLPGAPTVNIFSLTTNNGSTWAMKYAFTNGVQDLSKVSGEGPSPVVFTAVQYPGATSDGQPIIRMKKIVGLLDPGSPIVSDVTGFGSIGTFPTMFAWYKPYGADIFDPNHIIVPDITVNSVKVTFDGGLTWKQDTNLTKLVTRSGQLKFRNGDFTQISNIAFDPDNPGHILVGTVQAGIFSSCNNGSTWEKLTGSEVIPFVSSFYFMGNSTIIASSYGRGLWKLSMACPAPIRPPYQHLLAEEPLIYWEGAYIPISQIHNPDVCPRCGFYIVNRGDISEIIVSKENLVTKVNTTIGNLVGYTFERSRIETVPFEVSKSAVRFDAGKDEKLRSLLKQGYSVKGIYVEGAIFKGLVLAKKDITQEDLPRVQELKSFIKAEPIIEKESGATKTIRITGKGFDTKMPFEISVDGKKIDMKNNKAIFDDKGNMVLNLNIPVTPGGHTLLIEQKTERGTIKEATNFIIPLMDTRGRNK